MAPEAQRDNPVAFKSDMYSLGIILHMMLTKKVPKYELHVKTRKFNIPFQYSKDILALASSLLAKKPEARPTAKDLLSSDIVILAVEKL